MRVDFSKPIQTRAGQPARLLCTDADGEFPVVALIELQGRGFRALHYDADGFRYHPGEISSLDLVNAPATRNVKLWIVWDDDGAYYARHTAPTPGSKRTYRACREINVTLTEGEGV